MSLSDFLTILGLLLAAWAFIDAKQRQFLYAFFSNIEILVGLFLLVFIHYLLAFDWLRENWFSNLNIFTLPKGIPAPIWAYAVIAFMGIYILVKIRYGKFSPDRYGVIITRYKSLLEKDDIDLLMNNLEKYHLKDIELILSDEKVKRDEDIHIMRFYSSGIQHLYAINKDSKSKTFSIDIFHRIVNNTDLIMKSCKTHPQFYCTIIQLMKATTIINHQLINAYIKGLYINNRSALNASLAYLTMNQPTKDSTDKSILNISLIHALTNDTTSTKSRFASTQIGNFAIRAFRNKTEEAAFLNGPFDQANQEELRQNIVNQAISLHLFLENIYIDADITVPHSTSFLSDFVAFLLKNMEPTTKGFSPLSQTCAQYLIKQIINGLLRIQLTSIQKESTRGNWTDIALSNILHYIDRTNEEILNKEWKTTLTAAIFIGYYDEFCKLPTSATVKTFMSNLEDLVICPNKYIMPQPIPSAFYKDRIKDIFMKTATSHTTMRLKSQITLKDPNFFT